MQKYGFQRGLAKDLLVAVFFFGLMEILNILYPMILKNLVTQKVNNDAGVIPESGDFLISAGIVLGLLVIIFFVSFKILLISSCLLIFAVVVFPVPLLPLKIYA